MGSPDTPARRHRPSAVAMPLPSEGMSPVSRGRRRKGAKQPKGKATRRPRAERRSIDGPSAGGSGSAWAVLESLAGPRQRPEWFDSSITGVLDRADAVLAARGPRELEEAT